MPHPLGWVVHLLKKEITVNPTMIIPITSKIPFIKIIDTSKTTFEKR